MSLNPTPTCELCHLLFPPPFQSINTSSDPTIKPINKTYFLTLGLSPSISITTTHGVAPAATTSTSGPASPSEISSFFLTPFLPRIGFAINVVMSSYRWKEWRNTVTSVVEDLMIAIMEMRITRSLSAESRRGGANSMALHESVLHVMNITSSRLRSLPSSQSIRGSYLSNTQD
jgi:hypothetical protein